MGVETVGAPLGKPVGLEVEASQVGWHVLVGGESNGGIFTGRMAGASPMGELGQLVVRGRGPSAAIGWPWAASRHSLASDTSRDDFPAAVAPTGRPASRS